MFLCAVSYNLSARTSSICSSHHNDGSIMENTRNDAFVEFFFEFFFGEIGGEYGREFLNRSLIENIGKISDICISDIGNSNIIVENE